MLSAPATIPATNEATFKPAFAPLSVGTLKCCCASVRSPARSASLSTGTRPAARHQVRIVEHCRPRMESMRKSHLRNASQAGGKGP